QLEIELQANAWLHAPATEDLLFGTDQERKYDAALHMLGIDPAFLSSEAGHG
ncbi:MAG: YqgE/AlgH family protein, partial [Methylobacterium sp.]|nr:YqgE/AlgH family protein [Methylobacterium sp.]